MATSCLKLFPLKCTVGVFIHYNDMHQNKKIYNINVALACVPIMYHV